MIILLNTDWNAVWKHRDLQKVLGEAMKGWGAVTQADTAISCPTASQPCQGQAHMSRWRAGHTGSEREMGQGGLSSVHTGFMLQHYGVQAAARRCAIESTPSLEELYQGDTNFSKGFQPHCLEELQAMILLCGCVQINYGKLLTSFLTFISIL